MDRTIIEKPFAKELIKTRPGANGRSLAYVEGHEYIRRLNEVFNGDWSFDIEHHNILKDEVVVMGKLTAAGVSKSAFGGAAIKRHAENGYPISLSDDLKAAATDSLKKACSLLGIGLHLHDERANEKDEKPSILTQKQLSAIRSLGERLGLAEEELCNQSKELFGAGLTSLSRNDAGAFITALSEALGKRRGAA